MKYAVLLLLFVTSASAQDCFLRVWEDRVNQSDNPDAKAMDMCSDWAFDHRNQLAVMDPATVEHGRQIIQWMEAHDIALPCKVRLLAEGLKRQLEAHTIVLTQLFVAPPVALPEPESSAKVDATVEPTAYDSTLQGELLPPPRGADQP
ncbi:MAG: hypothetical protein GZ088_09530 [Acidipila sp.]|nr:hypothetical protein [Acidipila sp.]